MDDPFAHLERLQRELGTIAFQLTQVHFARVVAAERWRPAVNAYRCADRFTVCVDLAGADRSGIKVIAEARRLVLRGTRPPPEPDCEQPQPVQVLEMEIDYGPFERVLELPADIDPDGVKAEYREGLLWIYLPLRPNH
ncbi:MAG TPA: Hsp20/alpha crystallin family protein [Terrimicrobiaceae bacterium]